MSIYSFTVTLHSLMRWVVLIAGAAAVIRAASRWSGRAPWTAADNRVGLLFALGLDVQTLLGLALYLFISPITTSAFANLSAAMSNRVVRFWTVEHLTMMILALILVHVGRVRIRRASDGATKARRAAIWFGVALLLLIVAMPWPFLPYGRPLFRLR